MICQSCGRRAPTRPVAFYSNVGLLIVRLSSAMKGNLCKPCIHRCFWVFTSTNLVLGWWGLISFIINPFLIINNVVYYVGALGGRYTSAESGSSALSPAEAAADPGRCPHCGRFDNDLRQRGYCLHCNKDV
jgi:hypothetical protein